MRRTQAVKAFGGEGRLQRRGGGVSVRTFVYTQLPGRVVFGAGALDELPREIERLGARRALVLSTPEQRAQAEDVARRLGARCAGVFPRAVMHVPIEVAREARAEAQRLDADCAVAIGGGSTTGLGKAIALESALPILAIPTTYAGSEMTPIYGITEGGAKKTGRDARVLPKTVIYDPTLTLGLPVGLSVTSGMNAIAHAVEGLYAQDANPIMSMMAEEGIRSLAHGLEYVVKNPQDRERARRVPLRRVVVRRSARRGRHGAASQALPHARRHLEPAARRDPHRRPAARRGLQPRGRAPTSLKRAARALHARDAGAGAL